MGPFCEDRSFCVWCGPHILLRQLKIPFLRVHIAHGTHLHPDSVESQWEGTRPSSSPSAHWEVPLPSFLLLLQDLNSSKITVFSFLNWLFNQFSHKLAVLYPSFRCPVYTLGLYCMDICPCPSWLLTCSSSAAVFTSNVSPPSHPDLLLPSCGVRHKPSALCTVTGLLGSHPDSPLKGTDP